MRAKEYALLVRAVEEGVAHGLRRADKHAEDGLTEAQVERVEQHVNDEVVNAICEWFTFDRDDLERADNL